jgi:glycosyltransferase involved in cell wall biosynthesis
MSEHEGFCVPLIEAMIFGLPIFAKPAAAVPETLGSAGVLLSDTSPQGVAEAVRRTMADELALERLKKGRAERLAVFSPENVKSRLEADMKEIVRLWQA